MSFPLWDSTVLNNLSELVADPSVELFALKTQEVVSRLQDATFDSNSTGSVDVVSSHHADSDPSPLALSDGLWYLMGTRGEESTNMFRFVFKAMTLITLTASTCPCGNTGTTHLRPHRVLDAHHSNAGEAREDMRLIIPIRLSISAGEVSVCKADGPEALQRHWLNHLLHQVISVPRFEHAGLAIDFQDLTAPTVEPHNIVL